MTDEDLRKIAGDAYIALATTLPHEACLLASLRAIEAAVAAPLLERIAQKQARIDQLIQEVAAGADAEAAQRERIAALEAKLAQTEKDRDDADSMSKALAAVCDKNDARWKFLHTINKDAQGFEWCVMRVKWENGRISEAWHTNSDMSDMDAAIALSAAPAAPEQQAPNAQQAETYGTPMSERAEKLAADPVRGPQIAALRERLAQKVKSDAAHAAYMAEIDHTDAKESALHSLGLTVDELAQQAEAQEPFAFAYEYIHGKTLLTLERQEDWADNEIQLFARPQPAQLQALSEEEVREQINGYYLDMHADLHDFCGSIQSALAAKNGVNLAAAAMAPEEAE